MNILTRMIRAARRRMRYLRQARRVITGAHRLPRTALGTLDLAAIERQKAQPVQVLYLVGMPRTGTTLAKHHLGQGERFVLRPFTFVYWDSWVERVPGNIVLDKRTENINVIEEIWRTLGVDCAIAAIVRDPRDQLLSLLDFPGHAYIPRDATFWPEWAARYGAFLALAMAYAPYERFYLLRYEDLVRHPQAAAAHFATWLGTEAAETTAAATANTDFAQALAERGISAASEEAYQLARAFGLGEDPKFHANPQIHDESVGKWQQAEAHRDLLASWRRYPQAAKLMRLLGYGDTLAPVTPDLPGCRVFAPPDRRI